MPSQACRLAYNTVDRQAAEPMTSVNNRRVDGQFVVARVSVRSTRSKTLVTGWTGCGLTSGTSAPPAALSNGAALIGPIARSVRCPSSPTGVCPVVVLVIACCVPSQPSKRSASCDEDSAKLTPQVYLDLPF